MTPVALWAAFHLACLAAVWLLLEIDSADMPSELQAWADLADEAEHQRLLHGHAHGPHAHRHHGSPAA